MEISALEIGGLLGASRQPCARACHGDACWLYVASVCRAENTRVAFTMMKFAVIAALVATTLAAPVEHVAAPLSESQQAFVQTMKNWVPVLGKTEACADMPASMIATMTAGQFSSCEEAVGALAALGMSCDAIPGVGDMLTQACCAACAGGGGADPITKQCEMVDQTCTSKFLVGATVCASACADATASSYMACAACAAGIMGNDMAMCACCMEPIAAEFAPDIAKIADKIFPCNE